MREIAARVGTPAYLYSCGRIRERYGQFVRALGGNNNLICYAVKANDNLALLRLLAGEGAGFDIVSGGELYRVLKAGGRASRVVFSGVGKTAEEIDYALKAGILLFNCESESELRLLSERAVKKKIRARVALRVNPQVNAKTHPYIATGLREHKFGISIRDAEKLFVSVHGWPGLELAGLSCHIGSQISDLAAFQEALQKILLLAGQLSRAGFPVRYLDAGGGLAVPYRPGDTTPTIAAYGKAIRWVLNGHDLQLIVEPGRSVVADAGILLTRVIHTKSTGRKQFVIVDAAMNDLIRPALYDGYHEIRHVQSRRRPVEKCDVVGPVCETGDFIARNRDLPAAEPGDLLAIFMAGAYGFVLSSNYNARPRAVEVLVDGEQWRVGRRREKMSDLIRGEGLD